MDIIYWLAKVLLSSACLLLAAVMVYLSVNAPEFLRSLKECEAECKEEKKNLIMKPLAWQALAGAADAAKPQTLQWEILKNFYNLFRSVKKLKN